jgi:uncharacterized protein YecE (DUF72 family)
MGWGYDDWRSVFYTRDVKQERMLDQYARIFDTVEIDATFYGAPRQSTLTGWAAQVPESFRFSAKVPRAITHERRLVGAAEAASEFASLMRQGLGSKLGALLLQLPPEFAEGDRGVLESFVAEITSPRRSEIPFPWIIEFRHASWLETDIVDALRDQGVLVATTERLDPGGPLHYVRLLGTENSVARFDEKQFDRTEELKTWAERLREAKMPVAIYVRNFYEGHSPATLFTLRSLLGLPNAVPPGKQQMSLF